MPPEQLPAAIRARRLREARGVLSSMDYRVLSLLGIGGMGYVVKVEQTFVGRLHAIKLINPGNISDATLLERFFNEARVMGKLCHPNIVDVLSAGHADGHPYIVMEFMEGGTLSDHLSAFGPLPPRQAVQVTLAVLSALAAAHAVVDDKGKLTPIVHRDVKTDNVLITKDGTVKLGDFGIAHIEDGTRQLTRGAQTLGTLAYMAPEQHGDAKTVDARADLYAVGVTLYVMLTAPNELWSSFHLTLGARPDMMVGVIPEFEAIIRRATQENRDARYQSAADMATALRELIPVLLEDPEDTPALGSAPSLIEESVPAEDEEPGGQALRGSTAAPELSQETPEPSPSQTYHPDMPSETQFGRELEQTRASAKHRFFLGLGVLVAVLAIGGTAVWSALRASPAPEPAPVVQVEAPPPVVVVPTATLPDPVVVPAPARAPAPSIKKDAKAAVPRKSAPSSPEAAPSLEQASVRLTLKDPADAVTIHLKGEGGSYTLSSTVPSVSVPTGTYRVLGDFTGRDPGKLVGELRVAAGLTTISCNSRFTACTGPTLTR